MATFQRFKKINNTEINNINNINHKTYSNGIIKHSFNLFEKDIVQKLCDHEARLLLEGKVRNEAINLEVVESYPVIDEVSYIEPLDSTTEYKLDFISITKVRELGRGGLGVFNIESQNDNNKISNYLTNESIMISFPIQNNKVVYGLLNLELSDIDNSLFSDITKKSNEISNILNEHRKKSTPVILEYGNVVYDSLKNVVVVELKPLLQRKFIVPFTVDMEDKSTNGNFSSDLYLKKITYEWESIKDESIVKKIRKYMKPVDDNKDWLPIDNILNEKGIVNIVLDVYNKKYRTVKESIGIKMNVFSVLKILDQNNVSLNEIITNKYDDSHFIYK
jgi:hypothetical protein